MVVDACPSSLSPGPITRIAAGSEWVWHLQIFDTCRHDPLGADSGRSSCLPSPSPSSSAATDMQAWPTVLDVHCVQVAALDPEARMFDARTSCPARHVQCSVACDAALYSSSSDSEAVFLATKDGHPINLMEATKASTPSLERRLPLQCRSIRTEAGWFVFPCSIHQCPYTYGD